MPRQYTAIRDKQVKKGVPYDKAQSSAAAIYNSLHPDAPMSGKSDKKKKKPSGMFGKK